MRSINFPEANGDLSDPEDTDIELPVYVDAASQMTVCWGLGVWERLVILVTGRMWVTMITFGAPVQPQILSVGKPEMETGEAESLPKMEIVPLSDCLHEGEFLKMARLAGDDPEFDLYKCSGCGKEVKKPYNWLRKL